MLVLQVLNLRRQESAMTKKTGREETWKYERKNRKTGNKRTEYLATKGQKNWQSKVDMTARKERDEIPSQCMIKKISSFRSSPVEVDGLSKPFPFASISLIFEIICITFTPE